MPPPPVLLAGAQHCSRRFSRYELVPSTDCFAPCNGNVDRHAASAQQESAPPESLCMVVHIGCSDVIMQLLGSAKTHGSHVQFGGLILAGTAEGHPQPHVEEA